MQLADVISHLEAIAPPALQADYDNAGWICGDPAATLTGVLLTLDCTEAVVEEAIRRDCNLIIAHHPILFRGLRQLTGRTYVERTLIRAIRGEVAIYAAHTNLDSVRTGVNDELCRRLGLLRTRVLAPVSGQLRKLTVFVPPHHGAVLRAALHDAGAGQLGHYSQCSFRTQGTGTFRPDASADPYLGQREELTEVAEERLEVVVPAHATRRVLDAMWAAHPYEEVAYDLTTLENRWSDVGAGMVGELPDALPVADFLRHLQTRLGLRVIRHTTFAGPVRRVAVCGGAGQFLLRQARAAAADAFVTSDFKYHEFFDAEEQLLIADVGHYESEQFTPALMQRLLYEKMGNIAAHLSEIDTNPVRYFT